MRGTIFDIKEMAVHDGPGIRTTVFFKGCPLRCVWCHNPEGLISESQLMYKDARCVNCGSCQKNCEHPECRPYGRCVHACPENCLEIIGREVSAADLAEELKMSADILGKDFGGFTFSGGEPLAQPRFLLELINELKCYHLCIETSGYADSEIFKAVIDKLNFIIMDIKLADSDLHKKYTGVDNEQILKNFEILKGSGKPYIIRTPLIPDITDGKENIDAINEIIGESELEKLPYNTMAGAKYKMLGMNFLMANDRVPSGKQNDKTTEEKFENMGARNLSRSQSNDINPQEGDMSLEPCSPHGYRSIEQDLRRLSLSGAMRPCVQCTRILTITPKSELYPFHNVPEEAKFFYTLQGNGKLSVGGQTVKMKKGSALVIAPGVEYSIYPPEEAVTYIVSNFDYTDGSCGVGPDCNKGKENETVSNPFFFVENARIVEKRARLLVSESQKQLLGFEVITSGIMAEIIVTLLRLGEVSSRLNEGIVGEILRYIDEHYCEALTNQSIALYFGFHPNYLSSLIKQTTGASLHQHLIQIRLAHAAELLESGQYSINEVSEMAGFFDIHHFSRLFKKIMGMTPSEYVKDFFKE